METDTMPSSAGFDPKRPVYGVRTSMVALVLSSLVPATGLAQAPESSLEREVQQTPTPPTALTSVTEIFTLHGSVLTYGMALGFGNRDWANQFGGALNVEGTANFSRHLSAGFALQASPGADVIGFSDGPSVAVTDLYIEYADLFMPGLRAIVGSFDVPFSDQVEVVSNNADTFRNPFLINSLFMSAWGGAVGTLNTLGIGLFYEQDVFDAAIGVTNGTDELAINIDQKFEVFAHGGFNFGQWARVAGSALYSDDRDGAKQTGFGANLWAYVADVKVNFPSAADRKSYVKGYFGQANFGDDDGATRDGLLFWMVEGRYSFRDHLYVATRFSHWLPEDHNGDGVGISDALFSPGIAASHAEQLGFDLIVDQQVTRLQGVVGYEDGFQDGAHPVVVKLIFLWDDYANRSGQYDTDTLGGLLVVNVGF